MKYIFILLIFLSIGCNKLTEEDRKIIKSIQQNEIERMERGLNADTSYNNALKRFNTIKDKNLGAEPQPDRNPYEIAFWTTLGLGIFIFGITRKDINLTKL